MSSASQVAFRPAGQTIVVAANTVAPTGKQAPLTTSSTLAAGQFRVVNSSAVVVYLGVGVDAATAQANAVAPTAGAPTLALILVPGTVEVLSFEDTVYFSALAASAVSIHITPGRGM